MINLSKAEIEALIDLPSLEPSIVRAYKNTSQGLINLPPVGHIAFSGDADCHIKYGHAQGAKTFVVKIATGFPSNVAQGKPTGGGLSLVLSAQDGSVQAILNDEMSMTDYRTAVGSVIAAKALASMPIQSVLIVGTGVQAARQIEAFRALVGASVQILLWGRSSKKAEALVQRYPNCHIAPNLEQAVIESRLIITVTGATRPLIKSNWVQPGTHICAVGADAPGKMELDYDLLVKADLLVADSKSQCLDHGEFCRASVDAKVVELGHILSGHAGRTDKGQITITDMTGIAALDLAIADHVLARAKA